MADLQEVYARTAAGVGEIKARALDLTRGQRNLLIVIDGKNTLGSFVKMVGCAPEQMGDVFIPLIEYGLIASVAGAANPALAQAIPARGVASPPGSSPAQSLIALAERVFEKHAGPVVLKLEKAAAAGTDLLAAAESAAKLAKLTIDEAKAQDFLAEARRLISA